MSSKTGTCPGNNICHFSNSTREYGKESGFDPQETYGHHGSGHFLKIQEVLKHLHVQAIQLGSNFKKKHLERVAYQSPQIGDFTSKMTQNVIVYHSWI